MSTHDEPVPASSATQGGVQSVHRALDLLEQLGVHRESGLSDLAAATGLPLPTIHRLLQTLSDRGYVRRLPHRRYALGFGFVPLAAAAGTAIGVGADAVLARLVGEVGETANLAVLAGDRAQYVAQAPSAHSMRMFTEVGRLVELHSTGVGKALLARLDPDRVRRIAAAGLPGHTPHTLTEPGALLADLDRIRKRGYALDEQEQEVGVRCVAVAGTGPAQWLAVSISGPLTRMTDELVARAVPLLTAAVGRLGPAESAAG